MGCGWISCGDLAGQRLPVVDQLSLGDQLADPFADDVHAEHRAVHLGDQLDRALGVEDGAAAVAGQVVGDGLDLVGADFSTAWASVRPTDATSGAGVGDARDAGVVDRNDRQAGDVLGHQDAFGEADVRQLQRGR